MESLKIKDQFSSVINIALTIYDPSGTYTRHAGVVIASVLRSTQTPVCFYILHDETLSADNRNKILATYRSNASSDVGGVRFLDISEHFYGYKTPDVDEMCRRFTRGSLYRLCIHEILPELQSVIYLDCDIVVHLDIYNLWKEYMDDGGRHTICGVYGNRGSSTPDMTVPREEIVTDKRGLNRERYINSGVLVLNLARLREKYRKGSMLNEAVNYTKRFRSRTPDQDFINAEFIGDILYVDQKYNFAPDRVYDDVFSLDRIWHFYLKGKPWQMVTVSNADKLYWHYLMYTPWHDEIVDSFYNAAVNNMYYHRHSRDCINRLLRRFTDNVMNLKRIFK